MCLQEARSAGSSAAMYTKLTWTTRFTAATTRNSTDSGLAWCRCTTATQKAWRSLGGTEQLGNQRFCVIQLPQSLGDRSRVNRHGAIRLAFVDEIAHQRFDIAVENQTDDFAVLFHYRRARIPADNIVGRHEIERRGQIQLVAAFGVALRQIERRLVAEAGGTVVQTKQGRHRGSDRPVHR